MCFFFALIYFGVQPRPTVVDNKDGTYTVSFTPGWAAEYEISIFAWLIDTPFLFIPSHAPVEFAQKLRTKCVSLCTCAEFEIAIQRN